MMVFLYFSNTHDVAVCSSFLSILAEALYLHRVDVDVEWVCLDTLHVPFLDRVQLDIEQRFPFLPREAVERARPALL